MTTHTALRCLRAGLLVMTATLALSHCNDDAVEAGPSSLEFVWEVDTLLPEAWEYIGLSIWGTSETDLYVGGHDADQAGRQSLLRYNGTQWKAVDLRRFGLATIESVSGVDSSNMIVVGDGGRFVHVGRYRDGNWDTLRIPWLRRPVMNVHMVSPAEIYICGPDGVLRHDGTDYFWILDSSKTDRGPYSAGPYVPTEIRKSPDGNVYWMTSYGITSPPRMHLDMFNGDSILTIDQSPIDASNPVQRSSRYLRRIGTKLVTGNGAAYSVQDGRMTFEHDVDGRLYVGTDVRNNIFALKDKTIQHFDGTVWRDITPDGIRHANRFFPIMDAIYLDATLFVVVYDNGKTLVYKGKYM